jgi:hypothetical protein
MKQGRHNPIEMRDTRMRLGEKVISGLAGDITFEYTPVLTPIRAVARISTR